MKTQHGITTQQAYTVLLICFVMLVVTTAFWPADSNRTGGVNNLNRAQIELQLKWTQQIVGMANELKGKRVETIQEALSVADRWGTLRDDPDRRVYEFHKYMTPASEDPIFRRHLWIITSTSKKIILDIDLEPEPEL